MSWNSDRQRPRMDTVDRFVFKTMSVASLLYIALHWKSPYGLWGYAVCVTLMSINVVFTQFDVRFGVGRIQFSSKTQTGRALRWAANFLLNPLFFVFFPPYPGEAAALYLI